MDIAYWAISWLSTKDGPGNRVVVYMQGCPVQCPWCHSPHSRYNISPLLFQKHLCRLCGKCETVCPNGVHQVTPSEHFIDRTKCTHCGRCVSACPYSTATASTSALSLPTVRQDTEELFEMLRPQLDLIRKSGGITLSGGEALLQDKAAIELLKLCRKYEINTCVETSMLLPDHAYQKTAKYIDCWLLGFRGVYLPRNFDPQTVRADCKRQIAIFRQTSNPRLIARLPIIRGYTDKEDRLCTLRDILLENGIMELELLPCNPYMNHYYKLMGKEVELAINQCIPSDAELENILEYFRHAGIHATRGNVS